MARLDEGGKLVPGNDVIELQFRFCLGTWIEEDRIESMQIRTKGPQPGRDVRGNSTSYIEVLIEK